MSSCVYYQAHVVKSKTWLFVAVLRSFEHCCFDRTVDKEAGIFEFFIPESLEQSFLDVMRYFEREAIIHTLQKLPNRLSQ
jgi:hypothetical protein